MPSRLFRRTLLTLAGGIGLAGCLNTSPTDGNDDARGETDSEDEPNTHDDGADDSVGFDAYDFEVDVPEERHGEALENLLEGVEMINESEEGDERYIDGEISSYTNDGTEAETVVEYPEGYTDPDDNEDLGDAAYAAGAFIGEQIVINVLLGSYAYNADARPETFKVRYIEDGADEPFETSTSTAEEAAEFDEENDEGADA